MQLKHSILAMTLFIQPAQAAEDLDAALAELAGEVLSYFGSEAPGKIAIATMVHGDGTCSDLSERASDKLQGELFRAKSQGTAIIDRRSLSAIFREQELVEDGTISPSGAAKIAAVEQVDAIVTGKMTQYGDDLEFAVSMLDAVSGTVIGFADAAFRLSTRDEAMLTSKSLARCGFASVSRGSPASTPSASAPSAVATTQASQQGGAEFVSDLFTVRPVSLFYAKETGDLNITLRLTNTSDKELDLSMNSKVMSIQDNIGGLFELEGQIAGLAVCNDYRFCNRANQGQVTSLAPGTQAQLSLRATGTSGVEDLKISNTFEMYTTVDPTGDKSSKVVSVGFFDLEPTIR